MAARKTRRPRPPAHDREHPEIQQIFRLHLEASQRRDELLAEARELQAAGKIGAARAALAHADEIQQRLTALEKVVRPRNPHAE